MRIKTPKALAVLMELAAWREREAQTQDVPRSRILKDEALYDIASQAPRTPEDLGSLRSLHNGFARSHRGRAVLEAVARGLERDPETVPPLQRGEPMPPEAQAVVDLLRVLLKATAGRHGVAPKLIATSDELEQIALVAEGDPRLTELTKDSILRERQADCQQRRLGPRLDGPCRLEDEQEGGVGRQLRPFRSPCNLRHGPSRVEGILGSDRVRGAPARPEA